jgi:uncharacterized protein with HEPN domain
VTNSDDRFRKHVSVDAALQEMRDSCGIIETYTHGLSETEFFRDRLRQDAVIRRLEIIGEAAGRIMKAERRFGESLRELPLREAYEMRNFISHGYDAVDLAIVWDTVTNDIPALERALDFVIARRKGDGTQG